GAFLGTPAYMSPEQFEGREVDPRSDQFSFAIALWEALCGERPFAGDNARSLMFNVLQGERRDPPPNARFSRRIRGVLERALSRDPAQRWPDMPPLLAALEPPGYRRWIAPALIASVGLAAVAYTQLKEPVAAAPACQIDPALLAGTWDDETRTKLEAQLAAV